MQLLQQGSVGLSSAGNAAGRGILAELVELLEHGILGWVSEPAGAGAVVTVRVMERGPARALEILFNGGEILLRGGKIAGLEIGGELLEGFSDGIGNGAGGSGGDAELGLVEAAVQNRGDGHG